ncbi:hypothetical protein [Tsukamurella ocularis]|uniref:hypothetical protein n=1 Tax=Tsukamurella ocularis TaxID=1970234 RepID=UPI0021685323|nr:hypothetical protein [Tsukamurella ocularis]MCS3781603.1 hypothetical protein [Tsukamurella ocularis]MCS3787975.1 hypothetical protein [Tsukamurella ocularis]MCS3851270.1 hypothetical protein [Tsukamurella ocularis]
MGGKGRRLVAQQEAQGALAAAAVGTITADAVAVVIRTSRTAPTSMNEYYLEKDGGELDSVRRPREFDVRLLSNLRTAMYQEGLGTWFSAVFRVDRDGQVDATFNYDDEPEWDAPIDPIAYLTDQEVFPRSVENQPPWLQEKIAEGMKRRRELGVQ